MSCDPLPALQLAPNPVWRSYRGGRILRTFRGQPDTKDDHFPEDWLASTVLARNGKNSQSALEGLSRISDADGSLLVESLKQRPEFWFGPDQTARRDSSALGVLWKLLDSSVRLQFQAHPDAGFARRHLNSHAWQDRVLVYPRHARRSACLSRFPTSAHARSVGAHDSGTARG